MALDNPTADLTDLKKELAKCQNRGFTSGFLFGEKMVEQRFESAHEQCGWEFCGEIIQSRMNATNLQICYESTTAAGGVPLATPSARSEGGTNSDKQLIKVRVHNSLKLGDEVEAVCPREEDYAFEIEQMFDEQMNEIAEAHGGQGKVVYIPAGRNLPERSLLRRHIGLEDEKYQV
jgi:hypothetical protein